MGHPEGPRRAARQGTHVLQRTGRLKNIRCYCIVKWSFRRYNPPKGSIHPQPMLALRTFYSLCCHYVSGLPDPDPTFKNEISRIRIRPANPDPT